MIKRILAFSGIALSLSGCYYDNEEELYPVSSVACSDTTNVSYSSKVSTIMNAYCVSCHSSGNPSHGIVLDTYSSVKAFADEGSLLGCITSDPNYSFMPLGGNQLSTCNIGYVRNWIKEGAKNN